MFLMVISWWLVAKSVQNRATRKFLPIGILAMIYQGFEIYCSSTYNDIVPNAFLYWIKIFLVIGLGVYSLWAFRREL